MVDVTVRCIDFGYFVRPTEETRTGAPRVEPAGVGAPAGGRTPAAGSARFG